MLHTAMGEREKSALRLGHEEVDTSEALYESVPIPFAAVLQGGFRQVVAGLAEGPVLQ